MNKLRCLNCSKRPQDLPGASKASGVSRATFYRRVIELQMHLRMFGFRSASLNRQNNLSGLRQIMTSPSKNLTYRLKSHRASSSVTSAKKK